MKKKNTQHKHLYISIIFTCIVAITVVYMYDLFAFHTYNQRVYYDAVASINTDTIVLDNYVIFEDEGSKFIGNGELEIKDANKLLEALPGTNMGDTLDITMILTFDTLELQDEIVIKRYNIDLVEGVKFTLEPEVVDGIDLRFAKILDANIKIESNEQWISQSLEIDSMKQWTTHPLEADPLKPWIGHPLDIDLMKPLKSANRDFRMEAASISNNILRFGKLVSSYDLTKHYDTISIEYRYMNNPEGDIDDIDNYTVFKTISTTAEEYVTIANHGLYIHDGDEVLEDKPISVVIILGKNNKEFIFSMDMEVNMTGVRDGN
jgi:hypothetical protein